MSLKKSELKNEIISKVNELCKKHKIEGGFVVEFNSLISSLLEVKRHKVEVRVNDGVEEFYCTRHQQWEPVEIGVKSNGKLRSYCKYALAKYNRTNEKIKVLSKKVAELVLAGDFEKSQEVAKEINELKENITKVEFYNFEEDKKVYEENNK
jgi:hypothetical protein